MRVEVNRSPSHLTIHLWPYSDQASGVLLNSWIISKEMNPVTWKVERASLTVGNKPLFHTSDAARVHAGHLQRAAMLADDLDQVITSLEDFKRVEIIERDANIIFVAKRPSTGIIEVRIPNQDQYRGVDDDG